jgi:hypothetical protein
MKENYLKERRAWRAKYGPMRFHKIMQEKPSEQLCEDTARLLVALGQWRAHHKRNLKARAYQTTYRVRNREKMRTYHRNYKRKVRGTKTHMWEMSASG